MDDPIRSDVERAQRGDAGAFEALVTVTAGPLEGALARWTGSRDAAPDLVQEAYLRAYRNLARLDDPARFRGWLFAIGRQVACDWRRRERPRAALPLDDERLAHLPASTGCGPPDPVRQAVVDAVAALEPALRAVIELKYEARLGYDEIARLERIPATTVQARLRRAKRDLASRLASRVPELVPCAGPGAALLGVETEAGAGGDPADRAVDEALGRALPPRPAPPGLASRIARAAAGATPPSGPGALAAARPASVAAAVAAAAAVLALVAVTAALPAARVPTEGRGLPATRSPAAGPAPVDAAVRADPGEAPEPVPGPAPRPAAPAAGGGAGAARAGAPDVRIVAFAREHPLAAHRLSLNLAVTSLGDALTFLQDVTGFDFAWTGPPGMKDEVFLSIRARGISLRTTLDLVALLARSSYETRPGGADFHPHDGPSEPPLRTPAPLEEALLRDLCRETIERLDQALRRADLRLETPPPTLGEALAAIADRAGVGIVLLPGVDPGLPVASPIDASSLDQALRLLLDGCGGGHGYRVHRDVVLVGPAAALAAVPDPPPPSRPGSLPLHAPLRLRAHQPTPLELAQALTAAADGLAVVLDERLADGGPLPIALDEAVAPATLSRLLEAAGLGVRLVGVDGATILLRASDGVASSRAPLDSPIAGATGAIACWQGRERAQVERLEAALAAVLAAVDRPAEERIEPARAIREERAARLAAARDLRRAVQALLELRPWLGADDPEVEVARQEGAIAELRARAGAQGVSLQDLPAACSECGRMEPAQDEVHRLERRIGRLRADRRLHAAAVRFRPELERLESGLAPPDIFPDGAAAFLERRAESSRGR